MSYMNYILKVLILLMGFMSLEISPVNSQTCCSGGVPFSGNIGFNYINYEAEGIFLELQFFSWLFGDARRSLEAMVGDHHQETITILIG